MASGAGRTASNYILKKISEALERLNGLGFAVRLTPDKSKPDYSLLFERIAGDSNEIVDADPVAELIFEFKKVFHGLKTKPKRGRTREADSKAACDWIDAYGFEQAKWMVSRCRQLHDESRRASERVMWLVGLQAYEVAAADYERAQDATGNE